MSDRSRTVVGLLAGMALTTCARERVAPQPVTGPLAAKSSAGAWAGSSTGLRTQLAPTPSLPLRWRAPPRGCALRYRLSSFQTGQSPSAGEAATGVHGAIDFRLKAADGGGLRFEVVAFRSGFVRGKVRLPAAPLELGRLRGEQRRTLAGRLATDGRTLREVDKGSFWTAARPPLGVGFPPLPEAARPGSSAPFPLDETARGELRLVRWLTVGGALAAELEASGLARDKGDPFAKLPPAQRPTSSTLVETNLRYDARFLVLASGWVLYASNRIGGWIRLNGQEQTYQAELELRLLESCRGPHLAPPAEHRSLEEQALVLHGALLESTLRGDPAALQRLLAPELAARASSTTATLIRHLRRFGPEAIGRVLFPQGLDVRRAGLGRVVITLDARHGGELSTFRVRVEAQSGPAGPRLLSLRVAEREGQNEPLVIAPDRVWSTAATWSPRRSPGSVLVSRESFDVPLGRYLLLRSGGRFCAVRFTKPPRPSSAAYEWHPWDAARKRFGRGGRAVIAEHRTPLPDGTYRAHDDPLRCEGLQLTWSAPRYLYFAAPAEAKVEAAFCDAATLGAIDPHSTALRWMSYRWGELAYDHAAAHGFESAAGGMARP